MKYQIEPYDPCPCGSGKKYKFCCAAANRGKSHGKYPVGTVAYYGPDDKTATKIAAGVILAENAEPIMERWVATNILEDEKTGKEVIRFLARHGVKNVVITDGVLGCPHEEGEDYPVGTDCPFCPFWASKKHATGTSADDQDDLEMIEDDDEPDEEEEKQHQHIGQDSFDRMDSIVSDAADLDAAMQRLHAHLKSTLQLPCEVTGSEDFNWEEPYILGGLDPREYKRLKKTQPSYTDRYELLEIMMGVRSPWILFRGDLAARVRRLSDGKSFILGLCELEAVDRKSANAQLLRDYSCWFANSR